MKRLNTILTLFSVLIVLVAACSCGGGGGASSAESGNVTLELAEYKFTPNTVTLKAGQEVSITLTNKGEKDHEWLVGRKVKITDEGTPDGYETNFFDGIQVQVTQGGKAIDDPMSIVPEDDKGFGFMVPLALDTGDVTITFTVPEDRKGEWEFGCFEDDGQHYDQGMKGKLVIQ